ncbi:uncharacterized protein LOC126369075 [Pectinophora gossypiella]|uniref:uncharacterized protein LOC126369075 n=1 Tax=Pectinophora gossypiella TaxID=13191 RepID=UPI00214EDB56|nr:uncharacterized protein LOC126369075 [Pectinophora gossypiella]
MPPDMAINMRRSKLKAAEAALLSGELKKPTWESRNEGIHERVSFEDAIWGFDLAGGSYYKTPLRVVSVKPDSRAAKAGIRPGDRLKRINDIDTSTLTIQEAHKIIIDSGIHLKIAVTAPEDEEDSYYCYEDPIEEGYDSEEERRIEEEKARKREVHAKVSSYWSLQWPWVSKRRIIYRESNCFMVPSKFEEKHKSNFPTQPMIKTQEDIVLESIKSKNEPQTPVTPTKEPYPFPYELSKKTDQPNWLKDMEKNTTPSVNGSNETKPQLNGTLNGIPEDEELSQSEEMNSIKEDLTDDVSQNDEAIESKDESQNDISVDESNIETSENVEASGENIETSQSDEIMEEKSEEDQPNDDDVIKELLEDSTTKIDEENIIDSILSDGEEQMNSHSDER